MAVRKANTVQVSLEEVVAHLRQIQSAVVVAVAALKHQCAERDEDIANLLQQSVVDRLEDEIGKAEGALRALTARSRGPH